MDEKELQLFICKLDSIKRNIESQLYNLGDRIDDLSELTCLEEDDGILASTLKDIIKELKFDPTNHKLIMELATEALIKVGL